LDGSLSFVVLVVVASAVLRDLRVSLVRLAVALRGRGGRH
jgi:hypothetical protein